MLGLAQDAVAEGARLVGQLAAGLASSEAREALASSRPHADPYVDVGVIVLYSLALFALNWGGRLVLMEPFGRWAMGGGARSAKRVGRKKLRKFAQAGIEFAFYVTFTVLGLAIVTSQPWAWPSSQWWEGYADADEPHMLMRDDLRCYYLLYIARYVQGFTSALLEAKRTDFLEMLLHHTVTVAVCCISYFFGFNRVGVIVMFVLDPADVPLHLAKMFKYAGHAFCADRFFELFALMWLVMRLMMYPYICWSAHIEREQVLGFSGAKELTCVGLLYILLGLQVYWFHLIIRTAIRMMREGAASDVRSDDDTDDDEGEPPVSTRTRAKAKKKAQ